MWGAFCIAYCSINWISTDVDPRPRPLDEIIKPLLSWCVYRSGSLMLGIFLCCLLCYIFSRSPITRQWKMRFQLIVCERFVHLPWLQLLLLVFWYLNDTVCFVFYCSTSTCTVNILFLVSAPIRGYYTSYAWHIMNILCRVCFSLVMNVWVSKLSLNTAVWWILLLTG